MSPEILALIDNPELPIAVLAVGIFVGMTVERFLSTRRRQAWRARKRSQWEEKSGRPGIVTGSSLPNNDPQPPRQLDAADQLRIVMGANFTIQPLLNKSEARVFKEVDRIVIGCNPAWQVMAQFRWAKSSAARIKAPTAA